MKKGMIRINSEELLSHVTEIRRYLHMYPEKGFKEFSTSRYISKYLKQLGADVIEGIAGTGVIGIIKGKTNNSVAVRADMDCLDVYEQTGVEYSSKNNGLMHACGHDGHMAVALGLARVISNDDTLNNNIVFIFQPAEEGPGGAKPIVESRVLNKYNIKAFLGLHIFPEIEEGKIGCCIGPMTARNAEIDISIKGKSGHGALPHTGIDSIVVSSLLIQDIQSIITRRIDPRENAVITFGKINGGKARNIICEEVLLEGTIRTFSEEVYQSIKRNISQICDGISLSSGCKIDSNIRDMYPEVFNDKELFDILLKAVDEKDIEIIKPLMIAEDFSYYKQIAPELMFLLGSRNEKCGYIYPLHNSKFNFNEEILIKAVDILHRIIQVLDM